jgi:hypothetical protein
MRWRSKDFLTHPFPADLRTSSGAAYGESFGDAFVACRNYEGLEHVVSIDMYCFGASERRIPGKDQFSINKEGCCLL